MIITKEDIKNFKDDNKCKRCGLCCYLTIKGKPSSTKCKHLIKLRGGLYHCRNYRGRLYKPIGHNNVCIPRELSPYDYEGCPYNSGNKPVIYKNDKGDICVREN